MALPGVSVDSSTHIVATRLIVMGIAEEKYVSFTTYRRSGEPVSTPVWIAPIGDERAGFTTGASAGKAKRLAHTSRVILRPCDRSGRVAPQTSEVIGQARVALPEDPLFEKVKQAVAKTYGLVFTVLGAATTVASLVRPKNPMASPAVMVIDLDG